MIAPQNAETSAIQENYAKFRENSGKVGKIRENSGKSGKFGKIRKIQENSGNSGTAGELPGNCRGTAGEPKISPKNRKFCQKKTGNGAKLAQNAILSNFDVESGNLSVSAQFFVVLARFCCFCAFLARFCCVCAFFGRVFVVVVPFLCCLLNFHDFGEFSRISGSFGRKCR